MRIAECGALAPGRTPGGRRCAGALLAPVARRRRLRSQARVLRALVYARFLVVGRIRLLAVPWQRLVLAALELVDVVVDAVVDVVVVARITAQR